MGADKGRRADQPDDDRWDDDRWDDDRWDLDRDEEGADGSWRADDEAALWADAELDGRVRQRLAILVPLRHEAFDRWDEVQPRMTRARRRRRTAQALATSALVAAAALAGMQGAARFLPEDTSMIQTADGGDDMATSDSRQPMVGVGEATSTIADDGTTAPWASDGDATPVVPAPDGTGSGGIPGSGPADDTPAPGEASLPAGGAPGSIEGSSVPATGGSAPSSQSVPPPTSPPTSAPTASNSPTTVRSTTTTRAATTTSTTALTVREVSTIDVTVQGSEIRLVAIHNAPGVTSQVHNSGPEKIEITFTKGHDKHDLLATVRNGNVVTSVVDSEDD